MDILEKFIINEIKKDQILDILKLNTNQKNIDQEDPIVQSFLSKINKIQGNTKYFDWMKLMSKEGFNLDEIVEALSFYVNNKHVYSKLGLNNLNKNIDPEDILFTHKDYIEQITSGEQEQSFDRKLNFQDSDVIYKSNNWVAIVPKTMESSKLCAYSSSVSKGLVKWCTTARKREENYFYDEHFNSQFFVYLFKVKGNSFKNPFDKIALKTENGWPFEAYDATDTPHYPYGDVSEYIGDDWPSIKNAIREYFNESKEVEAYEGIEGFNSLYNKIKNREINDKNLLYEYFIKNIIKLRMKNMNWLELLIKFFPENEYEFLIKTWIELAIDMSNDHYFSRSTFLESVPDFIKELTFEKVVGFDISGQLPKNDVFHIKSPKTIFFNQKHYPNKLIIEGDLKIIESGRFSEGGAIITGDLYLNYADIYSMEIASRDIMIYIGGNLKIEIQKKYYDQMLKEFIEDVINNRFNVGGEVILDFY